MKKLVLILVCAVIMTVFIAFNYLLWDRENKIRNIENLNASKAMSIDALGDRIRSLDDEKKKLQQEIKKLEEDNKQVRERFYLTDQELNLMRSTLTRKNDVIHQLKKHADLKPLEETIRHWVEGIDRNEYEPAYELQMRQLAGGENNISFSGFIDIYKTHVKSMKVKNIKLYEEEYRDAKQGDIVFAVTLDVKVMEGSDGRLFTEGENVRYFTIGYDEAKDAWVIDSVTEEP